jgi:hypothetical protein
MAEFIRFNELFWGANSDDHAYPSGCQLHGDICPYSTPTASHQHNFPSSCEEENESRCMIKIRYSFDLNATSSQQSMSFFFYQGVESEAF